MITEFDTPYGTARVHLQVPGEPVAALVLGHGAGGGVGAPDLSAAGEAARSLGFSVALVEQPYLVAGRRSPAPVRQLDTAWLAVIEHLRREYLGELALVVGGRSSGARVACRTARAARAIAVLCLAFPLHPPGRAADPDKSRLPELDAVGVPTLVVQGQRDPFGLPPDGPSRQVVRVPGTHSLRSAPPITRAAREWLASVLEGGTA